MRFPWRNSVSRSLILVFSFKVYLGRPVLTLFWSDDSLSTFSFIIDSIFGIREAVYLSKTFSMRTVSLSSIRSIIALKTLSSLFIRSINSSLFMVFFAIMVHVILGPQNRNENNRLFIHTCSVCRLYPSVGNLYQQVGYL